jgi:hypothetical protein
MQQSKQFFGLGASTFSRRSNLLFLIPLLFSLLSFPALSATAAIDSKELQQVLKDAVENRRTVGIVVGIVDANNKTIYNYGKTANGGRDVDGVVKSARELTGVRYPS